MTEHDIPIGYNFNEKQFYMIKESWQNLNFKFISHVWNCGWKYFLQFRVNYKQDRNETDVPGRCRIYITGTLYLASNYS